MLGSSCHTLEGRQAGSFFGLSIICSSPQQSRNVLRQLSAYSFPPLATSPYPPIPCSVQPFHFLSISPQYVSIASTPGLLPSISIALPLTPFFFIPLPTSCPCLPSSLQLFSLSPILTKTSLCALSVFYPNYAGFLSLISSSQPA
jgi:hypothetical protein